MTFDSFFSILRIINSTPYGPWTYQKVCVVLSRFRHKICMRFSTTWYKQIVGIPMGTIYSPSPLLQIVSVLLRTRCVMLSLSHESQIDWNDVFNSKSGYLCALSNLDNNYFEQILNKAHTEELQLDKSKICYTEGLILDLNVKCINILWHNHHLNLWQSEWLLFWHYNFTFWDGVPRATSCDVWMSYIIQGPVVQS